MRQIIDGVLYDTDKAVLITEYYISTEAPMRDYRIRLYLSKGKKWFEHVQRSRYFWCEEGGISPLTPDEVYQVLCIRNLVDLIIKYFPDRIKES